MLLASEPREALRGPEVKVQRTVGVLLVGEGDKLHALRVTSKRGRCECFRVVQLVLEQVTVTLFSQLQLT